MRPPDSSPGFRGWLIVAFLCVVGALNYLDRNMITTMRSSIVASIPMTDAQFGLLTSIFLWVYGLLSPFAGYLADRYNRSRVIIVSLFVWSAVTWLTAHAKTFEQLFAARALMGISEACYIPAALALIADYHRGPTRSRATGIHIAGIMVGAGFGGIGGWLADRHEWTYPFTLFGLVGIAYAIFLAFVLRDAPRDERPSPSSAPQEKMGFAAALRSLLGTSSFRRALAAWGLVGIAGWILVGWAPTFFQERFQLTQGTAGFSVTGYLSGAGFAGVLLGGVLADAWSKKNSRARILLPAIGLCIAAPGVLLLNLAPTFALAVAGLIAYGVTRNFLDANMMPIVCHVADERYRATGYGLLNLCACMIGGVGIYAGGALRDAQIGLGVLFLCVVGCIAVAAGLLFSIQSAAPHSRPA